MVVGGMSATDLRVPNVPLAQIEDDDPPSSLSNKSLQSTTSSQKSDLSSNDERAADVDVDALLNNCSNEKKTRNSRPPQRRRSISQESNSNGGLKANVQRRAVSPGTGSENMENQGFGEETFGGSLEDLVENFDEKITHCFKNLNEATDDVAPVQMRSQDEIMSESQCVDSSRSRAAMGSMAMVARISGARVGGRQLADALVGLSKQPSRQYRFRSRRRASFETGGRSTAVAPPARVTNTLYESNRETRSSLGRGASCSPGADGRTSMGVGNVWTQRGENVWTHGGGDDASTIYA
uniref:Uncharacterized protein n=1 Tax=Plectus sambesii TaxID=2011161 RepID=A0A914WB05_9BILA